MISESQALVILRLSTGAGIPEIKDAYRKRAKLLHPDVNKNSGSHEEFILLTEAYEFLIDLRSGKRKTIPESEEERRKAARAKAAAYARMKYEEFLNSEYYRSTSSLSAFIDLIIVGFFAALMIYFTILAGGEGTRALITALVIDVIIICLVAFLIRKTGNFDRKKYTAALIYLLKWQPFCLVFFSVWNIVLFLKIGLQTLIPLHLLLALFILFTLSTYLGIKVSRYRKFALSACWMVPLFFNVLLLINYLFVCNQTTEHYAFKKEDKDESTLIHLENETYEQYAGMRVFFNYSELSYADHITYTIADGCLGFRVVKDYRFN
jgi:hypothetical protein